MNSGKVVVMEDNGKAHWGCSRAGSPLPAPNSSFDLRRSFPGSTWHRTARGAGRGDAYTATEDGEVDVALRLSQLGCRSPTAAQLSVACEPFALRISGTAQ